MTELAQERLKELLHYNPDTGMFTWKVNRGYRKTKGKEAGHITDNGYRRIALDKQAYYAHRLAFLYMDGAFPPDMADHINRERADNRWCNLRHADINTNGLNRKDNLDYIGVHPSNFGKNWNVKTCMRNGKARSLGYYYTHLAACYSRWAYDMGAHYKCDNLRGKSD